MSATAARDLGSPQGTPEAPSYDLHYLRRVHRRDFATDLRIRDADGDVVSVGSDAQSGCGRHLIPFVNPEAHEGEASIWVCGLKQCSSVWACPVCADRICRKRGREVAEAVSEARDSGHSVYFLTLTMPHHRGHRLDELYEALSTSWAYLKSGAPWGRWADRMGYRGCIRAIDATVGPNGWHVHIHAVLIASEGLPSESNLSAEEIADRWHDGSDYPRTLEGWRDWMADRWARKLESFYRHESGELRAWPLNHRFPEVFRPHFVPEGRAEALRDYGVRVSPVSDADDVGRYVSRLGLGRRRSRIGAEVAEAASKAGRDESRTPLQVLADYAEHGAEDDARRWRMWAETMHGKRHLVWSPGLREELLGEEREPTDEELAEEPPERSEDTRICTIDRTLWKIATAAADGSIEGEVCRILDSGNVLDLRDWLQALLDFDAPDLGREVRLDGREKRLWCRGGNDR